MARRKLIFFTTADPAEKPGAIAQAYHFAAVAGSSGLEAEVRLAGDAVTVAKLDAPADDDVGRDLHAKVGAGADGPFLVSL